MEESNYHLNLLLTEHFGYPPLALIDDIINAVNELLYKCTQGMETYLNDLRHNKDKNLRIDVAPKEIGVGTAKLETLLESQVDKNFDKFELYALRNIFTVPQELVDEGWIRLKHHEGIDFHQPREKKIQNDQKISELIHNIKLELHLRKILKLQIRRAGKVIEALRLFQQSLKFLDQKYDLGSSIQTREAIKSLAPLDETLHFLLNQVEELVTQTRNISSKMNGQSIRISFSPNLRDLYVDTKSIRILEKIGLLEKDKPLVDHDIEEEGSYNGSGKLPDVSGIGVVTVTDIEIMKEIAEGMET